MVQATSSSESATSWPTAGSEMRERVGPPPAWNRLLVRLPNWVGDVVMASPALRALRQALPDTEIIGFAKDYVSPLLDGSPHLDRILRIGGKGERGISGACREAARLRELECDAALLFTNSLTTVLPVVLAGIPERIGYAGDWRSFLLTRRRQPERALGMRRAVPMPVYYQRLLDLIGVPPAGPEYDLVVDDRDRHAANVALDALGWDGTSPLAGINPGARFGSSKLWLVDRLAETAKRLKDEGMTPLVLCGPGEEEMAHAICSKADGLALDASKHEMPLRALGGVLEKVSVLITTDAGPRHMAVALDKPTVVIIGSTDPAWTEWNLERTRVVTHEVPCGPCHLKTCPIDHRCMTGITVDEVVRNALELVA